MIYLDKIGKPVFQSDQATLERLSSRTTAQWGWRAALLTVFAPSILIAALLQDAFMIYGHLILISLIVAIKVALTSEGFYQEGRIFLIGSIGYVGICYILALFFTSTFLREIADVFSFLRQYLVHAKTHAWNTDQPSQAVLENPSALEVTNDEPFYDGVDLSWLDQDGRQRHSFDEAQALAALIEGDVCFLNAYWWKKDWPEDAQRMIAVCVNCSDVFAWGSADAEDLEYNEIEALYRMWKKDPAWGPSVFCMLKRKQMPQKPVEERIRAAGIWDLDNLGLGENWQDAETQALFAAYTAKLRSGETNKSAA